MVCGKTGSRRRGISLAVIAIAMVWAGAPVPGSAFVSLLEESEAAYLEMREAHDRWQLEIHRGANEGGRTHRPIAGRVFRVEGTCVEALEAIAIDQLSPNDAGAVEAMFVGLGRLPAMPVANSSYTTAQEDMPTGRCPSGPKEDIEALRSALYGCFAVPPRSWWSGMKPSIG